MGKKNPLRKLDGVALDALVDCVLADMQNDRGFERAVATAYAKSLSPQEQRNFLGNAATLFCDEEAKTYCKPAPLVPRKGS